MLRTVAITSMVTVLLFLVPIHVSALKPGSIGTADLANGAVTNPKIANHSVNQTQLTFTIHNGTNGANGASSTHEFL